MNTNELRRFNAKIKAQLNGCIFWIAGLRNGYGVMQVWLKSEGRFLEASQNLNREDETALACLQALVLQDFSFYINVVHQTAQCLLLSQHLRHYSASPVQRK